MKPNEPFECHRKAAEALANLSAKVDSAEERNKSLIDSEPHVEKNINSCYAERFPKMVSSSCITLQS